MIVKLIINKQSDSSLSRELDFSKFPVVIGRDEKNDVILYDNTKVISRKHAKIIDTEGILQLIDLGSSNFTYLNESKIIPGEENALAAGDKINIGDYEIEVQFTREENIPDDDQKTMVFINPFQKEMSAIVDNLNLISEKFMLDNTPMKKEMLRLSLRQNMNTLENNIVSKTVAEYFTENFLDESEINLNVQEKQVYSKEPLPEPARKKASPQSPQFIPDDFSFSSHFANTIDVLLDVFGKLVQGFLQFRQEFFGITIYYTIPAGSLKELKDYLFDPKITNEEGKKRHDMFSEEAQKLLIHQIGLLEGYKNSVTEGSKYLLQSLDPDSIEKDILKKKSQGPDIGKFIPIIQKGKILHSIKENYKKYISDPYYIEKKFFRPAFLKGYQKRIPSNNSFKEF